MRFGFTSSILVEVLSALCELPRRTAQQRVCAAKSGIWYIGVNVKVLWGVLLRGPVGQERKFGGDSFHDVHSGKKCFRLTTTSLKKRFLSR